MGETGLTTLSYVNTESENDRGRSIKDSAAEF